MLSSQQIEQFITDGYIRLDRVFSKELANEGREILWRDMGCNQLDSKTWQKP